MKSIIPLQYYRDQIPEVQIKNIKNDGVKFQAIYNKFVELGIKGARRKNKVRRRFRLLYWTRIFYQITK